MEGAESSTVVARELVRDHDADLSDRGDLAVLASLPEKDETLTGCLVFSLAHSSASSLMSRRRLVLLGTDEVRDARSQARTGGSCCSKIFARLLAKDEIRSRTIEGFAVTVGAVDPDICESSYAELKVLPCLSIPKLCRDLIRS